MRLWFRSFVVAIVIVASPLLAHSQELSADEAAVWALEEAYWRIVKDRDVEAYKALWDTRAVTWGGSSAFPETPAEPWGDEPPAIFPELFSDASRVWDYELQRREVRAFGDTVIVHYWMRDIWTSAESGEPAGEDHWKVNHVWRRSGDSWKIISTMSNMLPPPVE